MEQNKKGYAIRTISLDDYNCNEEYTYFYDDFETAKRVYINSMFEGYESIDFFAYEKVDITEDIKKEIEAEKEERKRIKEEEERKEAEKRDQAIKKREYEEYLRLKEKFENN